MNIHLFIRLKICLFIRLNVYLFVCAFIRSFKQINKHFAL